MEPEMISIFVNTCMGISKLMRITISDPDVLLLIARKAFDMADVNAEGCIEYIE